MSVYANVILSDNCIRDLTSPMYTVVLKQQMCFYLCLSSVTDPHSFSVIGTQKTSGRLWCLGTRTFQELAPSHTDSIRKIMCNALLNPFLLSFLSFIHTFNRLLLFIHWLAHSFIFWLILTKSHNFFLK